jgi:hypothetical protein
MSVKELRSNEVKQIFEMESAYPYVTELTFGGVTYKIVDNRLFPAEDSDGRYWTNQVIFTDGVDKYAIEVACTYDGSVVDREFPEGKELKKVRLEEVVSTKWTPIT